ncbi:MAG: copper-binding protein [Burkholderiaceae bacterium]|nr:copper-binding protein [Burkholderiaceae bacterium]MDO9090443.1 copper-binding protein [Burkholderiaceae bacterium]MDP1968760.1 copper-binding protein [Burkholderiaceae bacterium]
MPVHLLKALLLVAALASSTAASPADVPASAPAVYTRGEFRSASVDDGGRTYARINVVAGQALPFSTLRFRVQDRALVQNLKPGARVEFRAQRLQGENTLTDLRPASQ